MTIRYPAIPSRLYFSALLFLLPVCSITWQIVSAESNPNNKTTLSSQAIKSNYNKPPDKKSLLSFKNVESFPGLLRSGKLNIQDIPNPHWKKNACIACHKSGHNRARADNLRSSSTDKLCNNCHSARYDHRYIHPSNVRPDKKMMARMAPAMKTVLKENRNRIDCKTCHDLSIQCLPDTRKQHLTNPKFFRAGPHDSRSQLCFLCHDKQAYQRLNPHDQIDDKGRLRTEKCVICHADPIDRLRRSNDISQLTFNTQEPLVSMCWGCHPWTPHPGGQFSFFSQKTGPNHLRKPSDTVKNQLDRMSRENNISFPLEPGSGRIFCGTCHNAHEKGVIENVADAKGADSRKRLRAQKICQYCHFK